jgi:hypothetical protein
MQRHSRIGAILKESALSADTEDKRIVISTVCIIEFTLI